MTRGPRLDPTDQILHENRITIGEFLGIDRFRFQEPGFLYLNHAIKLVQLGAWATAVMRIGNNFVGFA